MKFNDKEFKKLRNAIKEALADVEKEFDISLQPGNISYNPTSFTMKIEGKRTDVDTDRIEFEKYCCLEGFEPTDYRREFVNGNDTFMLIGFNPKNRKNVCKIEDVNSGKTYKCSPSLVKNNWVTA
jgi:hypothetical protein